MFSLDTFYKSVEWTKFRENFLLQKLAEDGDLIDEITKQPIYEKGDAVLHHKIFLTEENVNDLSISLNPKNIQLISAKTHNQIHDRFGIKATRQIFITSAQPTEVNMFDLVVSIERIQRAIGGNDKILQNVYRVYNSLLDSIFYKFGKWTTALIIHDKGIEYERIKKRMGAIEWIEEKS